jgi:dipeptidyl aminopeptidase/acylaminoacyl peptidase
MALPHIRLRYKRELLESQVMLKLRLLIGIVILAQSSQITAQKKFSLTIDNIMRGPELYGNEPSAVRWSEDGHRVYFQWKQANEPRVKPNDTYVVNRDGSGLRKLTDEETKNLPPASGSRTKDRKKLAYAENGDIFVYDFSTGTKRQLTKTSEAETNPQFTFDEKRVTFLRGGNLYAMSLDSGMLEQLTDIRTAAAEGAATAPPAAGGRGGRGGRGGTPPAAEAKGTDSQEFLKKQEVDLLLAVKERKAAREEAEAKRKKDEPAPRKPFQLQARQTVGRMELCPDGKSIIAMVSDGANGVKNENVPNYITESAYTEDINGRSNVGEPPNKQRAAILDVAAGEVKWIDAGLGEREVQLQAPVWNEAGTKAFLVARSADNKDRWILALDPATGKSHTLFTEHDDAWLGGGGGFGGGGGTGWLKHSDEIYFLSEKYGYSNLFKISYDGGDAKPLVTGKFEVSGVELSKDGKTFFFTSSEVSPFDRHFYSMSVDGGARKQLTKDAGNHRAVLSPDEKALAEIYSYTNKPPELFVDGKKITSSPSAEFWDYKWMDVPIVEIPARDGVKVPARLYKPANFKKGGPAVMFVHGAGYLQNVHHWWSQYEHEYMFNHFLMEHGYLVIDIDYRGSAGYGRDWRTAIYRHMGGKDLDDHVDAAKFIVSQYGVDPKRIGLYGGSYGGFITLMAMFTAPDTFAAGAALRPVTDWAHYNNNYTANILNLPQKDEEAYKKSSPIYFADGLKGALLICHGMVDTNVFFQDSVRLVQRLIELHKENWSVAPYPVEDHGFVQPSSWADEYKRIYGLFETNLKSK